MNLELRSSAPRDENAVMSAISRRAVDFSRATRPKRLALLRGDFKQALFLDKELWQHFGSEERLLESATPAALPRRTQLAVGCVRRARESEIMSICRLRELALSWGSVAASHMGEVDSRGMTAAELVFYGWMG
jgi:hypothetical protein